MESGFKFRESSFEFMNYNDLLVALGLFFGPSLACATEKRLCGEAVISQYRISPADSQTRTLLPRVSVSRSPAT
jgi:hypothetical protein